MTDYIEHREGDGTSKRGGYNLKRNIPLTDPARDWKRITDHRGNTVGYFKDEDKNTMPDGTEEHAHRDYAREGIAGSDDWMSANASDFGDLSPADLGGNVFGYKDGPGGGGSLTPNDLPDEDKTHIFSITEEGNKLIVKFGPTGELQPRMATDIVLSLQGVPTVSVKLVWNSAAKAYIGTEKIPASGGILQTLALAGESIPAKITVSPLIITADTNKFLASSGLRI